MPEPEIRVGADAAAVAEIAAGELLAHLRAVLSRRERAALALSGGSTPEPLYRRIACDQGDLAWEMVDLFLADERCVASDDAASNYKLIGDTLLREPSASGRASGRPRPTLFRVRGELGAEAGAADYARALERRVRGRPPVLDAVVLGVGSDGHTASLFPGAVDPGPPGSPVPWVVPGRSPSAPRARVSLSMQVLRAARFRLILVTGTAKAPIVARVLGASPEMSLPAARLAGSPGRTLWVLDEAAAADLVVA